MKLNPPKNITWYVALILAVLGLLGFTGTIGAVAAYAFWLALASAVLLLLATLIKDL